MLVAHAVAVAQSGRTMTAAAFQAEIAAAQGVVSACGSGAAGCDPAAAPADGQVRESKAFVYQVNWQWLRDALKAAKTASPRDRDKAMSETREHVVELGVEAGSAAGAVAPADFARSRTDANAILAGREFQADAGPSWLDRQVARLQDWFLNLLMGMNHLGQKIPWLAPLIEWSCFLLAAGGLLFFIRRSLARQSLRISLGENAALAQRSGRDTTDWARLAEERAAAADWREALHCSYWAAITSLEARRAWRVNPTRTPREYLGLLSPGSAAQAALRDLTRSFESVWYGHATATEREFRAAQTSFAAIAAADLKRPGAKDGRMATTTAAAGAG